MPYLGRLLSLICASTQLSTHWLFSLILARTLLPLHRKSVVARFPRAIEGIASSVLVRAAIQYLRHHEGDADAIMPSLFPGRGGRKKAVDDKPDARAPSPTPVIAPPTPAIAGNNGAMDVKLASDDHGPFVH